MIETLEFKVDIGFTEFCDLRDNMKANEGKHLWQSEPIIFTVNNRKEALVVTGVSYNAQTRIAELKAFKHPSY